MPDYVCNLCNSAFTTRYGLNKHMNKQIKCFTTNQTLKNHIAKTCPIIKNKKTEGQLIENMQNKIEVLSETVNELKSKLNNQLI
jgi:hypothetical protein